MSINKPSVKVGDVFKTKTGDCKIVEYYSATNVIVEFLDEHKYQCKVEVGQLKKGKVRNVFYPSICDIGFLGEGVHNSKTPEYKSWCYAIKNGFIKQGDGFCNFQIFSDNFKSEPIGEKWVNSKRVFSGSSEIGQVCKIPLSIHNAMSFSGNVDGDYLLGVFKSNVTSIKPYSSKLRKRYKTFFLGVFDTPEEAHQAYVFAKETYVKELALEYTQDLPKYIFDALMEWTVKQKT